MAQKKEKDLESPAGSSQLQGIIAEQQSEIDELRSRIEVMEDALDAVGLFVEEGMENEDPAILFRREQLQILFETMAYHPDYLDIDTVLTEEAMEEEIVAMAAEYTAERGGDPLENVDTIRTALWRLPNPYRVLYDRRVGLPHDTATLFYGQKSRTEH